MIREVAVSPDAIRQLSQEAAERRTRQYLRIARDLPDHCVLALEGRSALRDALVALRDRPPDQLRQAWEVLLDPRTGLVQFEGSAGPLDPLEADSLTAWAARVSAVAVDSDTAGLLEAAQQLPSDPEVVALEDLSDSETFAKVHKERFDPVRSGASRDRMWTTRFLPLSPFISDVYIIDIHLLDQVFDWHQGVQGRALGAIWFLERVATDTTWNVHIASQAPKKTEERARAMGVSGIELVSPAVSAMAERCGLSADRFGVGMAPNNRPFEHERSIHFDSRVGLSVHNGLETFARPKLQAFTFSASMANATLMKQRWDRTMRDCDPLTVAAGTPQPVDPAATAR